MTHRSVLPTTRLVPGKGSPGRGSGPGANYWHVYDGDTRVGHVFINIIDKPPVGTHASIQVQLNAPHRGRGIGRTAYRLAVLDSDHDVVYAHMRKSNVASRSAAEHAGFHVVFEQEARQRIMVWYRCKDM